MTTLKKMSNESKIARPASLKPRTRKNESPLKQEEKTPGAVKPATKAKGPGAAKPATKAKGPGAAKPATKAKGPGAAKPATKAKVSARAASKKTTPRKTVAKTPTTEKKSIVANISVDQVAKPAIASNPNSDSGDETKGRVHQVSSNREKTTSKTSPSPLRYGVENGEMIADQLIRANCEVCIFWLDAMTQFRKTNLEKMALAEEAGQMADKMARGLLEAGKDQARNAVRQAAKIANTGISNIEGMQVGNMSLFTF